MSIYKRLIYNCHDILKLYGSEDGENLFRDGSGGVHTVLYNSSLSKISFFTDGEMVHCLTYKNDMGISSLCIITDMLGYFGFKLQERYVTSRRYGEVEVEININSGCLYLSTKDFIKKTSPNSLVISFFLSLNEEDIDSLLEGVIC